MKGYKVTTIGYSIAENERIERENRRLIIVFLTVFIVVLSAIQLMRSFVFMSVVVSGRSMNETMYTGDMLFALRLSEPDRYDVVVFNAYGVDQMVSEDGVLYIKRVIAFEGEEVWTKNGKVYYSTKNADGDIEEFELDDSCAYYYDPDYRLNIPRTTVPEGCYFVLGDNRAVSRDSRSIGCVPKEKVLGVVPQFAIDNKDDEIFKFFVSLI